MTITKVVRQYFPQSKIVNINRPKGGISADMTIVELQKDNLSEKIVIRQIESAANEFRLLNLLQTAGVASPTPLFLDESCEHLPRPFLILIHIDGQVRFQPDDTKKAGAEIGKQLAKIHSLSTNSFDLSFLPLSSSNLPDPSGHPLEEAIFTTLRSVWPMMQSGSSTLIHGDFWPGNLIWQDKKLMGVIDWEDAKLGNSLQDLAISRFDTLFIFGQEAMEALTHSYFENRSINLSQLPYWDLHTALRAIRGIPQWAAGWPELGRPDLTENAIWDSLHWFIQQTKAKIDPSAS